MAIWFVLTVVVSLAIGYGAAIWTAAALPAVLRERMRVEHERRLAEMRIQHLTTEAFRSMLRSPRD